MKFNYSIASLILLPLTVVRAQQNIGDFLFVSPDPKKTDQLYKAKSVMLIEWEYSPKNISKPDNVTIEIRHGAWPDVTEWEKIADEVPNEDFYEWEIPESQFPAKNYILRISTKQRSPSWVRDRTSQFFQIYTGTITIGNEIVVNSSGNRVIEGMLAIFSVILSIVFW